MTDYSVTVEAIVMHDVATSAESEEDAEEQAERHVLNHHMADMVNAISVEPIEDAPQS